MGAIWKKPKADLRKYYTLFLEIGMLLVLIIFITALKIKIQPQEKELDLSTEQEAVQMEEVIQTKQKERPPPPPRPPVPVEVPNDMIIENEYIDIDAELVLDRELSLPPPPEEKSEEEDEEKFFVVVEQMPELIGGMEKLQDCVVYPQMARKAGIEGRVVIQFIVNDNGQVENPQVLRGIGGGADEEALRCVKQAEFKPGLQRGIPVRVQYSLPIIFRLKK